MFLNTDNFLLHHVESEGWEISFMLLKEMLGGVPGHIPRPNCGRCSLLCNTGKVHPALTCWLIMYLQAQTICLSYGNVKPADILWSDRIWLICIYLNVKYYDQVKISCINIGEEGIGTRFCGMTSQRVERKPRCLK